MNQEIKVGQLWMNRDRNAHSDKKVVVVKSLGATTVTIAALGSSDDCITIPDEILREMFRRPNWFERTFSLPKEEVVDVPRISKWNERMGQVKEEELRKATLRMQNEALRGYPSGEKKTDVYTGSHSFKRADLTDQANKDFPPQVD